MSTLIGAAVEYHGSLAEFHGSAFVVGTRDSMLVLVSAVEPGRFVCRPASVQITDLPAVTAEWLLPEHVWSAMTKERRECAVTR